jgi:UDP-N-acetylglucosamine 1-carboxyvinyltransferase
MDPNAPRLRSDLLEIRGGSPLTGTVAVDGSKNAALPMLAAAACVPGRVQLANVPDCTDVKTMLDLLRELGWELLADKQRHRVTFADFAARSVLPTVAQAATIRASYYLVPSILGQYGMARLPWPGGCSVGERGMDLHFTVYETFGDHVQTAAAGYTVHAAPRQEAGTVHVRLPFRSRGATVVALLRAVVAGRPVVITNPSLSAELHAIYGALTTAGCELEISPRQVGLWPGDGTDSVKWRVPGDKIEAGTLACAIAASGGRGHIDGISAADVAPMLDALATLGVPATVQPGGDPEDIGRLTVLEPESDARGSLTACASLDPDGLDADWEPGLMVLALGRPGRHRFADAINPGRHGNLLPELRALGAVIIADTDTECYLAGPQRLKGTDVRATDIRTGSALLIAGLAAHGTTRVTGLAQLRRGHADLPAKLAALGADLPHLGGSS